MATVRKSKGYVEEVDFGEKVSGYSSSGAIPFNNASNIPLKIRASINDSGHGAFLVDGKRAFETFVPARTRYELPISFAPPTVGAFNATLTIVFNNGSTAINGERFHNISLSGSGQNARLARDGPSHADAELGGSIRGSTTYRVRSLTLRSDR